MKRIAIDFDPSLTDSRNSLQKQEQDVMLMKVCDIM